MKQLARLVRWFAVFSLPFAIACGDEDKTIEEVVDRVGIVSFSSSSREVAAGGSVTLSWQTKAATDVAISANGKAIDLAGASAAEGSVSVALTESTSFVLEATGASGDTASESLSVTVTAEPRPFIDSFAANPATVEEGGTVFLAWQTKHADTVKVVDAKGVELELGDAVAAEGQVETSALGATTSFKLVATRGADWAEKTVVVTVTPKASEAARVLTFTADANEVEEGGKVRLSWTTENAEKVQLFDGLEELALDGQSMAVGSADVFPRASTTYRLVASKGEQFDEKSLQVKVAGFPSVSLGVSPSPIDFGGETTVTWTTDEAESVSIADTFGQPLEGGAVEASGSRVILPSTTTTYQLTAVGSTGKESHAVATVEVRPAVLTFATVRDEPAGAGDLVALEWTTGGATSLQISNLDGETKTIEGTQVAAGTASLHVGATGKFELVARSGRLETRRQIDVEMIHVPAIASFRAIREVVTLDGGSASARLAWTGVTRAETLELDSDTLGRITLLPADLAAGFKDVEIDADTSFTLTARNAAGFVSATAAVRAVAMPEVISVSTWPDYLGAGEEVELTWSTSGATNVVIEANGMRVAGPHPGSGSASIAVDVSTTFEVKAYNDALDFDSAIATVSVGAPQILTFTASRTHAWTNSAITFEWTTRGAGALTLFSAPGVVAYSTSVRADAIDGSFTTQPLANGDYEFVLEIENASGVKKTKTISVRVGAGPSIDSFTVNPAQLLSGADVSVQWAAGPDPDGVMPTLDLTANLGGPYSLPGVSGTKAFTLTEVGGYLFTLTATTESTGSAPATMQASASVFGTPAVTLVATPAVFDDEIHSSVELAWTSENADTSLELFKLDGANPPILLQAIAQANRASGTFTAPAQTANTTYRIVATNGLAMTAQKDVTVNMQGTQVLTFTAAAVEAYPTPAAPPAVEIVSGDTAELSWTTKRATHVALSFMSGFDAVSIPDAFEDITTLGATLLPMSSIPGRTQGPADEGVGDITFPASFSFPFGGANRTQLRVFSNGVATFDMSTLPSNYDSFTNGALGPTQANARVNLAPFWDDLLLPDATNSISWLAGTDTVTNEQYVIVQWTNVGFFSSTGVSLNFQMVLHEDGRVDYRYGTMNGGATNQPRANGNSATIGVSAGSLGHKMLNDTHTVEVPGGLANKSFRFSVVPSLPLSGSQIWTPPATTSVVTRTATIAASGIGAESKSVDVKVHPRASATLALNLPAGELSPIRNVPFTLSWTSQNASGLRIEDESGTVRCTAAASVIASGSCSATVASTGPHTFTAVATGALGHETRKDLEFIVTSANFGIDSFEVSAALVDYGQPVTLSWETGDADLLEIKANGTPLTLPPTIDLNSDSFVVPSLTEETTFVLTITNTGTGATRTESRKVTVRTFSLDLSADQTDVPPGTPVNFNWNFAALSGGQPAFTHTLPLSEVTATSPFVDITGMPGVTTLTMSGADTGSANVTFPAGFTFKYMGKTYSAARVFTDGYISFDTTGSATGSNVMLPSTSNKQVHLAAFWEDLHLRTGSILAGPVGTSYVIQWKGVSAYYGSNVTAPAVNNYDLNFQIVLNADGSFEYRYGTMAPPPGTSTSCKPIDCVGEANGSSATIGYQNDAGTKASVLHHGGTSNASDTNRPFAGGLANRSFRYEPTLTAGTATLAPWTNGSYEICVTLDGYTECKSVAVTSEFKLNSFDASATTVNRGEPVVLSWTTKNADVLRLKAGTNVIATEADVDVANGTFTVFPTETTTYSLEVENTFLRTKLTSSSKTVTVKQFDLAITAPAGAVTPGTPVTLTWNAHTFSGAATALTLPMVEGTGVFTDISTAPDVLTLIGATKDSDLVAIPASMNFQFPYLGINYTGAKVSTDGFITFDSTVTTTTSSNSALPTTSTTKVHLAPFWDDLHTRDNGRVYAAWVGPDFVVQWTKMSMTSGSKAAAGTTPAVEHDLNFQVVMRPDGSFEYRYGTMSGLTAPETSTSCQPSPSTCSNEANGSAATIGYQDPTGKAGAQVYFGGSSPSSSAFPIAGGLTGRSFEFTPATGAGGTLVVYPGDNMTYRLCAISGTYLECAQPATVQVDWKVVSFRADSSVIPLGGPVTLSWQTVGADSIRLWSTVGSNTVAIPVAGYNVASDSLVDTLTGKTTYKLEVESKGRFKSATVVVEAQTVSVSASAPSSALAGETVTVTWNISTVGGSVTPTAVFIPMWEVPNGAGTRFSDLDISTDPTATQIFGAGKDDDIALHAFPGGFVFPYMGTNRTGVHVSVNGLLSFDSTVGTSGLSSNASLPSTSKVQLAAFWDDVFTRANGKVLGKLVDADTYVVQWSKVSVAGSSNTNEYNLNFQVVLKSDGSFEYRYGTMAPPPNTSSSCFPNTCVNEAAGSSATIGYQDVGGTTASLLHFGGSSGSASNPPFPGGLANRTFRYAPALSGSSSFAIQKSGTYTFCAALDGYKECKSVEILVPTAGDVMVTEVMADPVGGQAMQWFEVRNLSPAPLDLETWEFATDDGVHTINQPLVLGPGQYATFAASPNPGFTPSYVYGNGLTLGSAVGGSLELRAGLTVISKVQWDGGWSLPTGASFELDPARQVRGNTGPNVATAYCAPTTSYDSGTNLGTPGAHGLGCTASGYTVDYFANKSAIDITAVGQAVPSITGYLTHGTVNLSFTFPFFGGSTTLLGVDAEGYVAMSALSSSASSNVSLPSTSSPANKGIIAPFWDDMSYSRHGGTFRWAEVLQGGQKVAVLQWTNLSPFDGATSIKVTFQAQLWENGDIVFVYQDMQGDTTFTRGSSATIGIQAPGTTGTPPAVLYSHNRASVATGSSILFKKL